MRVEEPEAYRIGDIPFLGLTIYLDSRPLIPRVETEYWVEKMMAEIGRPETLLDLCSGSGVIGCVALKELPSAHVYFGEIDPKHETTIRKNIRENNLDESRADVRMGDLFEPFKDNPPAGGFDAIAVNPPYVPAGRALPDIVTKFEPEIALRGGADGLAVIRRIAKDLRTYLKPTGQAWIECDIHTIEEAKKLFEAEGYQVKILEDQYQRPRVLVISSN